MCTIPPPPPPPLNLLSATEDRNSNLLPPAIEDSNIYHPVWNNPLDCIWAEDPELRRACIVARICLQDPPYKYKLTQTKSVIQVGPTCGLAALSMLVNERISADTMLAVARKSGYTNHGEMLSCNNMDKLVSEVFGAAGIDIKHSVKKGNLDCVETVDFLLNGGMLLVPYDADVNHAPALKRGHTAHWCVVCGIILVDKPSSIDILCNYSTSMQALEFNNITETPVSTEICNKSTLDNDDVNMSETKLNNIYILARHGKSKFLSAWKLSDLARSNQNLWEFSPKKQNDDLVYVQPNGGLGGENGLRSQYLMFTWP